LLETRIKVNPQSIFNGADSDPNLPANVNRLVLPPEKSLPLHQENDPILFRSLEVLRMKIETLGHYEKKKAT